MIYINLVEQYVVKKFCIGMLFSVGKINFIVTAKWQSCFLEIHVPPKICLKSNLGDKFGYKI